MALNKNMERCYLCQTLAEILSKIEQARLMMCKVQSPSRFNLEKGMPLKKAYQALQEAYENVIIEEARFFLSEIEK